LLLETGVKHDDLVTLSLPNHPFFLIASFAIYKAGATPHIVSPNLPLEELQALVDLAKSAVVIGNCNGLSHPNKLPADFDFSQQPLTQPAVKIARFWKAMSSGGSTGRPKHECIRVSYAQDEVAVRRGVQIIAEEVANAYADSPRSGLQPPPVAAGSDRDNSFLQPNCIP